MVKKDSTITRRVIQVGITDDALHRYWKDGPDDVVNGVVTRAGQKSSNSQVRSPFMPARRGGGKGGQWWRKQ